MSRKCNFSGLLMTVLALVGLVRAADVTGSIDGVVKDQSGAVAVGIDVSVTNTGTNATVPTLLPITQERISCASFPSENTP